MENSEASFAFPAYAYVIDQSKSSENIEWRRPDRRWGSWHLLGYALLSFDLMTRKTATAQFTSVQNAAKNLIKTLKDFCTRVAS